MVSISKEDFLYARNDKDELVPVEVDIIINKKDPNQSKFEGQKIKILPLKRQELKSYLDKSISTLSSDGKVMEIDINAELVVDKCVDPKFTKEDVQFMKPIIVAIVNTIIHHSGLRPILDKEPETKDA
jgi:hypothetical protein